MMTTKPAISQFTVLAELLIQKYERYLPTAYDESLSLLEKVNMVIVYLNEIGKVNNDVVTQWNEVMEWVMNDGLKEGIIERLDLMVSDGTFDTIINETLMSQKAEKTYVDEELNKKITRQEPYLNVRDYGAVGDGVADDSDAIQNAFNDAFLMGKQVFIQGGTYKITKPLYYRPYVKVFGEGKKTVLKSYITDGYLLDYNLSGETTGPHGVTITELFIEGTNHVGTGGGIHVTSSGHGMTIDKCWITNFSKLNQNGLYGDGNLYYFTVQNCNIQNCYIGIYYNGIGFGVNNCVIDNTKLTTGEIGILLEYAPNTIISGCQIEKYNSFGIECKSNHVKVNGSWMEQNVIADIRFKDCFNSHAQNIYTWRNGTHADNYSIKFVSAKYCTVKESYFNNRTNANTGVFFDMAEGCVVDTCGSDVSTIHTGPLGSNLVKSIVHSATVPGIVHRTDSPNMFFGGIWLSQTAPANTQNGVLYDGGTGLIKREDSINKYIPALSNKIVSRSTIPSSGTWNVGDIMFFTAPVAGGKIGAVCVTSGTPGVWKQFGAIDA